MKRTIIAYLIMIFYTVEFKREKNPWGRTTFRFHPRKILIKALLILISPVIFVVGGIIAVKDSFKEKIKIEDWSSYFFSKDEPETKLNAFKKF